MHLLHIAKTAVGKLTITNKLGVWCSSRKGADVAKRTGKKLGNKKKCKVCGREFTINAGNQMYCSVKCREKQCRIRHTDRYQKIKAKRAEENKKKKAKKMHLGELAAFNDKAKQMGLTYGQYMIFLQTKKDQEERAKIS